MIGFGWKVPPEGDSLAQGRTIVPHIYIRAGQRQCFHAKLTNMSKIWRIAACAVLCVLLLTPGANGQSFDVVGTRAAGMGGAFVGVADDASAVYWNPAGLAAGSYFSLILDGGPREAIPDEGPRGSKQSSFLIAATMPALGLSYYRLRQSLAVPDALLKPLDGTPVTATHVRVDSLVTHHAGVTLVQSILPNVSVGSTLKVVHGVASTHFADLGNVEAAIDADEVDGRGTTRVDADLGLMASAGKMKLGIAVRNLREPEFTSSDGRILKLERQARAGVSYALLAGLIAAADFDLLEVDDAFGNRRDAAFGVEARLAQRAWVRSGYRFNTSDARGNGDASDRKAITFGGTFAATASVLLDALVISGGDQSGRGWGVSARFVY